jgi:hypothetical protein
VIGGGLSGWLRLNGPYARWAALKKIKKKQNGKRAAGQDSRDKIKLGGGEKQKFFCNSLSADFEFETMV